MSEADDSTDIQDPNGQTLTVHRRVAPLLQAMWSREWIVYQGELAAGRVTVQFATLMEAQDFLTAVLAVPPAPPEPAGDLMSVLAAGPAPAARQDDPLRAGVLGENTVPDRTWRYRAQPEDWADDGSLPEVVFTVTIDFPVADLDVVIGRLGGRRAGPG